MNEEYIDNVKHLIEQKDADQVKELLADLHPADIAELCNDLNPEEAKFVYRLLNNETAADVLVEMDEDARKELLDMLPSETIAKRFVDYMDTDDAVDLMRELDEDKQEEILSHIEDIEQAGDIVDLLKYDENTAGGLMGTEMVLVNENWSMPECLKEMRQQAEELDEIYYVYVIDDDERLRGIFPLKKMITSPSVSKVKHVMQKDPISVHVDTPIDEVVQAIEKYDLVAIPVIDSIGRLVGQITVDDVMDEVREQSERDYQLASGLSQDVETDDNVLRQTTARLPWLLIGMIGGIGNSMILGNFDSIDLYFVNTANMADPAAELRKLTGGTGFDDVFCYAPIAPVVELSSAVLGRDGCLNFFAGPTDKQFSAKMNFYDVHYNSTHVMGTTGGNTADMIESLELTAAKRIDPAVMVTHIGGLNAAAETTLNLPKIPGGKKLIYTHLTMPLIALTDLRAKGEQDNDPRYTALADIVDAHNGLWCPQCRSKADHCRKSRCSAAPQHHPVSGFRQHRHSSGPVHPGSAHAHLHQRPELRHGAGKAGKAPDRKSVV